MTTITKPTQLPKGRYYEQTDDAAKAQQAEAAGRQVFVYRPTTALRSGPVTWYYVEMPGGLK